MSIPGVSYVRLIMGGQIATAQSWSTGISLAVTGGGVTQSDLDTLGSAWAAVAAAFWDPASGFGVSDINASVVTYQRWRAYLYGPSGSVAALAAGGDVTPVPGALTSNRLPVQTCLVASLRSGLPGRRNRGRMYLPCTAAPLGTDHQIPSTTVNNVAIAVKALVDGINGRPTPGPFGRVVVAGSAGIVPLTSVLVDSEPDIQRRHADKLVAGYSNSRTFA